MKRGPLSIRSKLTISFVLLVVLLLLSSIISIFEYRRMSDHVSEIIAGDIHNVNVAQKLSLACDEYNIRILTEVGEADRRSVISFDQDELIRQCDSIRAEFLTESGHLSPAEKVNYSYTAYMLTSLELKQVIASDFIDSREWFFDRLQPRYDALRADIGEFDSVVYQEMMSDSEDFQGVFYRSMVPGFVSVGACIVLMLLLLFFILTDYVRPLNRMASSLAAYTGAERRRYNVTFEGDDQLARLNEGITDLVEENIKLRKRIKATEEH